MVKIIPVNKSVVDVFWGDDGWEPHTRLRLSKNANKTTSLDHVSGTRLPAKMRNQVVRNLGL